MRKYVASVLSSFLLIFQLSQIPSAIAAGDASFSESASGIFFDGGVNSNIQLPANSNFDIAGGDFTIDWWQKASPIQTNYPRLFQFGDGALNSDGFAVSEEDWGLYFWMDNRNPGSRGANRANIMLPNTPTSWNHFAIVRNGYVVTIYLNGAEATHFDASVIDPDASVQAIYTMFAPSDNGDQPLIIGGSNADNLGGFHGEVNAFEFLKGAKWVSDFTPPTQYSTQSCQRIDSSNNCTLESILLLLPSDDFTTSQSGLINLIDGTKLTVNPGVTFGDPTITPPPPPDPDPTPNPPEETIQIWLTKMEHGYICLDGVDGRQCTTNWSQNVTIIRSHNPYIYFYPDDGYEINETTIATSVDAISTPLTSGSFSYSDGVNGNFNFTWDESGLQIPSNFVNFDIQTSFKRITTEVHLLQTLNGKVCVNGNADIAVQCSDLSSPNVTLNPDTTPYLVVVPDYQYDFESLTIAVGNSTGMTTFNQDQNFSVIDANENEWIFTWSNAGVLNIPQGIPDFEVNASFKIQPPRLIAPSVMTGNAYFNSNEAFEISSADPLLVNDYSDVAFILVEIPYFVPDPNDVSRNLKMRCRSWAQNWLSNDDINNDAVSITFWLPSLQYLIEECPGYHQSTQYTQVRVMLFDSNAGDVFPDEANPNLALQALGVQLLSPPSIARVFTTGSIYFDNDVATDISNIDRLHLSRMTIYSNDFHWGWCKFESLPRAENSEILPSSLDENGHFLFHLPSATAINSNCADAFNLGVASIDLTKNFSILLEVFDEYGNSEGYAQVIATGAPSSDNQSQTLDPDPAPSAHPSQGSPSQTIPQAIPENISISEQSPSAAPAPAVNSTQNDRDTSWCQSKGIWIFTISGKFRLCDPRNKIALEIKSCAGRESTPTFPWIFKPQRFASGISRAKSGKLLINAIFFYKGLAISGAKQVANKPCSNGSVFIPIQHSKFVFNFAKTERPIIWVKAS